MKKEMKYLGIVLLLSIIIAIAIVYPQENAQINNPNQTKVQDMTHAFNNIKCKVDFFVATLNHMNTVNPSTALTDSATKLQADLTQLQANTNNKDAFKSTRDTLNNDLKSGKDVVQNWRREKKNLTVQQRKDLKDKYAELKTTFDSCNLNSLKEYGNGRITSFNSILDNYQKEADKIAAKGVDVSSLTTIINDAKTQIVNPLQTALSSATDEKSVRDTVKKYCLFDGCKNGINFHLAAKFAIAKLEIALNIIKTNATNVSSDKISKLEGYINSAKTTLASIGTSQYSLSNQKAIWDNIKNAHNLVKEIKQSISMSVGNKK